MSPLPQLWSSLLTLLPTPEATVAGSGTCTTGSQRNPDKLPLYPNSLCYPLPACIFSHGLLHWRFLIGHVSERGEAVLVVSFLKSEPWSRGTQMRASTDHLQALV